MKNVKSLTDEELADCIASAKLAPAKYLDHADLLFHGEAITEAARRLRDSGRKLLDEDLRLAYYYLSLHRSMLENMRLGYMKRFEDSEGVFTNEKAKADRCQCDINTIDGYLERFREYALAEGQVMYLNPDYSRKLSLSFKMEDLGK